MSFTLWPHQEDAISAIAAAIRDGRLSGLVEQPTGTGKTLMFLTAAHWAGLPTLVLVHRDELVRQTMKAASAYWPAAAIGRIQGRHDDWSGRGLVVASIQSLNPRRRAAMPRDYFELVVMDECHHVAARTWSETLEYFRPLFRLGVTATPDRLDGRGLAPWFGAEPIYRYTLRQAIEDGCLVRVRQFAIETKVQLDGVAVRAGDFATRELGKAVGTQARNQAVVEAYRHYADGRKAIAFAVDVAHTEMLQQAFEAHGIAAVAVSGRLPLKERRQALADFAAGRYRVLVNCEICTEGYDERSIECMLMARPTQSRALYQQCIGRGLRVCPEIGKQDCLILDFADNCRKHKVVSAMDLFGMPQLVDAAGRDLLELAYHQERTGRRASGGGTPSYGANTAAALLPPDAVVRWHSQEVPLWPELPSLDGYRATRHWHDEPATARQLSTLEQFGSHLRGPLTKGQASYLIGQCQRHSRNEPATYRQARCLRDAGYWRDGLTKGEASAIIGQLCAGDVA